MDSRKRNRVYAHIVASYFNAFLDKNVYDRLLATPAGRKLANLSPGYKNVFRFIAHTVTAIAAERGGNPTAVRTFLDRVILNAGEVLPSRVDAAEPDFSRQELRTALELLTDEDLDRVNAGPPGRGTGSGSTQGGWAEGVSELTDQVNASRARMRAEGRARRAKRSGKV